MHKKTLWVFGAHASCVKARLIMENHPQVRRVDIDKDERVLTLLLYDPIRVIELIPLLKESGISGFRYE